MVTTSRPASAVNATPVAVARIGTEIVDATTVIALLFADRLEIVVLGAVHLPVVLDERIATAVPREAVVDMIVTGHNSDAAC